ncbi:hypothetical protein QR680_018277 [Steinernema hermaphroditum]|uniref:Ground-like domain-containing protein n=1 Tax=Steinernema hermaphroditum TaxID=289476 RepID=A0AA39HHG6_9BILA|nr:hypothetical protein QR680_018277 [Steinernema hermaphroditum]
MIRLSPLLLALFWILDVADGLVVLSGDTCSSPELRAAIEKSLKEDVAQTLVALREELMTNIKPAHFVIFCGPSTQDYKYVAQSCHFCTHSDDKITCHVFESNKK